MLFGLGVTGVEGGFDVGEKKYDIQELCSILVMPGWHEFPVSFPNLPPKVILVLYLKSFIMLICIHSLVLLHLFLFIPS